MKYGTASWQQFFKYFFCCSAHAANASGAIKAGKDPSPKAHFLLAKKVGQKVKFQTPSKECEQCCLH
jgi:hypothetical protein